MNETTPLTSEEMRRLQNSSSEKEWNAICDEVKHRRNGRYPPDWFQKVIQSGLSNKSFP